MLKKHTLRRAIRHSKRRISRLEQKRARSQAALIEAILRHTNPADEDVDYFNRYTDLIEKERQILRMMADQLDRM